MIAPLEAEVLKWLMRGYGSHADRHFIRLWSWATGVSRARLLE